MADTRHPVPGHLSEDDLMRFADGELPSRQAAQARTHLEACWECRTGLEEMQKTVGDCIKFRKTVLESYLPPPPAPWFDIRREFMEADLHSGHRTFWAAAGEILLAPARRPWRWAPVAAGLATAVILWQFWQAPRVEAAALLRQAATAAASAPKPAAPRRIRIRKGIRQVTRTVGVTRTGAGDDLAGVDLLFASARYNGADPLSAASYLEWHGQLREKQDAVRSVEGAYEVRTSTASSELMEATLVLRERDLHAVEGVFRFRSEEPVVITELPPVATAAGIAPPAAAGHSPVEPPAVGTPATAATATATDELRVIAALHRIGADLGDPLEVVHSGGKILVTGFGLEAVRRDEIARTLGAMPRVAVQFHESGAMPAQAEAPVARRATAGGEATQLQRQLQEYLGGRPAYERFADRLIEGGDSMMAHAHALRRLAERFPPAAEATLEARDGDLLHRLREEHAAAVRHHGASIDTLVTPALRSLGVSAQPMGRPVGGNWQARAAEQFQAAQKVEKLLAVMVAGAALEGGEGALGPRLLGSIDLLRSTGAREGQ